MKKLIGFVLVIPVLILFLVITCFCTLGMSIFGSPFILGIALLKDDTIGELKSFIAFAKDFALAPIEIFSPVFEDLRWRV